MITEEQAAAFAVCRKVDPDLFYPDENGQYKNVAAAKAACTFCPIKDACREAGVHGYEHGIWGGTTEEERVTLRAQLPEPPPFRRSYGEPTPRTHCHIGHQLTESNIIHDRPGRVCKACFEAAREREKTRKAAKRREAREQAAKEQAA
jgi:hypothetical protein